MTSLTRVVVTGSESTGKSTLAARLAAHFGVLGTPEFVRGYAEHKGAPIDDRDHRAIALGQTATQVRAEASARSAGHRLLLHDTDLVSTVVYCHHYVGQCLPAIEDEARRRLADHYLLLDIDVPWVPDGVRDREHRRHEVHALFEETLRRFRAPFTVIRGSWDDRFSLSKTVIDSLLGTV